MEQKKIIRVVVFPLFISLFILGFTTILPSVKASKKGKYKNNLSIFVNHFNLVVFIQIFMALKKMYS